MVASVARDIGIDLDRPGVEAAAQRLGLFKALPAQPRSDVHGTDAVMADDDQSFINVEFLLRAGWHFAHRQMQAALNMRGGKFPWLAHVDEPGTIFAQDLGSFGGGDFVGQHSSSLDGGPWPADRPQGLSSAGFGALFARWHGKKVS